MRGNKNTEVFLQMIILLSMSLFLIFQLVTGKINYYVHPRYRIGIWTCAVVLLLFAIKLVTEVRKGRHNSNSRKYTIYFLPIGLALLFPVVEGGNADKVIAQSIQPSYIENENISQNIDNTANDIADTVNNEDYPEQIDLSKEEPADRSLKYADDVAGGVIRIDDEYYSSWYYDLFDYLEDFKGKRYQFLAQVYSMEGLGEDEFLAGRYIMVCCATDLTGYGIICKSDMRKELKEDEWILITATIDEYEYEGTLVPFLSDPVIERTQAPKEEYVYYNFY